MTRSSLIFSAALGIALAGPALAQDYVGSITGQLRDLGFEQIEVKQTLLGRARIIARSADGQREIILNPNNGEILRDFWQAAPGRSATSRLVDNRNSGGSDRGGSDDTGNAGSDDSISGSDDSNSDSSGSGNGNDDRSGSDDRDGNSGSDDDGSDDSRDDSDDSGDDDSDGSDDSDSGGDDSDDSSDD